MGGGGVGGCVLQSQQKGRDGKRGGGKDGGVEWREEGKEAVPLWNKRFRFERRRKPQGRVMEEKPVRRGGKREEEEEGREEDWD